MSNKSILSESYLKKFQEGERVNLEELFSPFIQATRVKTKVMFTTLDNFKKKFKITSNVLDPMEKVWEKYPHAFLAGGKVIDFVLNKSLEESVNDYDVYRISFSGPLNLYSIFRVDKKDKNPFMKSYGHLVEIISNDNLKWQFMNKDYNEPEELIEDFDYRCCAICTNGKYIWWVKGCLKDIRDKRITVQNPKSVMSNFIRIQKYLNKGYSISCVDYNLLCINTLQSLLNYNYSDRTYSKDVFEPIVFNRYHVYNREEMQYCEDFAENFNVDTPFTFEAIVEDTNIGNVRNVHLPNLRDQFPRPTANEEIIL